MKWIPMNLLGRMNVDAKFDIDNEDVLVATTASFLRYFSNSW
jgi:hypothetical protein